MASAAYNRMVAPIRAFLEEVFSEWFRYSGQFQYVVSACDWKAQTCDLDPVNQDLGMPALVSVPIRSPLLAVRLAPGEPVTVAFENNSPAFPFVCGLPAGGPGALPVARQGDMCWVTVELVPATIGASTASMVDPTGTFWTVKTTPGGVPPTLLPNAGGTLRLYGIAATGSQSVKAR